MIIETICDECGTPVDVDANEQLNKHDAGIGTIYWHTDNLKLQQVIKEFLENELPNKLKSA